MSYLVRRPKCCKASFPDVASCLVLDIRLHGLSGLDFQTELANANLLIRIILLQALPAGLALLVVAIGRLANIEGCRGS